MSLKWNLYFRIYWPGLNQRNLIGITKEQFSISILDRLLYSYKHYCYSVSIRLIFISKVYPSKGIKLVTSVNFDIQTNAAKIPDFTVNANGTSELTFRVTWVRNRRVHTFNLTSTEQKHGSIAALVCKSSRWVLWELGRLLTCWTSSVRTYKTFLVK